MRYTLIVISLFLLNSCTQKSEPKSHLKHVTLKLSKSLTIALHKIGKSPSDFNIEAEVYSPDPILKANAHWIILDSEEKQISKTSSEFNGSDTNLRFDSGHIRLKNPNLNHKIVFIFNGKTTKNTINKTAIYNSLIQDEIDSAIKELQDRNQ